MRDSRNWSIVAAVICAAQLGVMPPAIEGRPDQGQQRSGQEVTQAALPKTEAPASSRKSKGPPDGKWLVNDDGRRYYVIEIPKRVEGQDWMWIGENAIRIRGGLPLDVVAHDDKIFSVKVYEILPRTRKKAPDPPSLSEEELAEVAAQYRPYNQGETDSLRFEDFGEDLPRRGQWRNGFDIDDMNGDGHLDIVFGAPRKGRGQPHIFLGDSRGSWRFWAEADYPNLPYDYGDAEAADFDGDGHVDIALGMHLSGMAVLKGDGVGNFTPWTEGIGLRTRGAGSRPAFSSRAITTADLNQDGKPDLLAFGEGMGRAARKGPASKGILIYANNGDGTWTGQPVPSRYFGDAIEVGDFNGDGLLDLVTSNNTMGAKQILLLGTEDGAWEPTFVEGVRPGAWVRAVAFGRLDDDDLDDVLVGYSNRDQDRVWRTGVDVIYGSRDGSGTRQTLLAVDSRASVVALDSGDLNGDRRPDVVALTGNGEVWVFLGDEDGHFVREASPELPKSAVGCHGYAVRLVDVDRDGRDEVVAAFAGEATGLPGISREPGCPGEGSLRAWTALSAEAQAADLFKETVDRSVGTILYSDFEIGQRR